MNEYHAMNLRKEKQVPRLKKPPTQRTIARQVAALLRSMAAVYSIEGSHQAEKTGPLGTIKIEWRSGSAVLGEKPKE